MAQQFNFGFEIEDSEHDETQAFGTNNEKVANQDLRHSLLIEPMVHSFNDLLPRRELFDTRAQMMAGDVGDSVEIEGLAPEDIKPSVYEGGFKTWECSLDLATYLAGQQELRDMGEEPCSLRIVEFGAGTALPTCLLFAHYLSHSSLRTGISSSCCAITVCDYNISVLKYVTIPNLLLTWASQQPSRQPFPHTGDLEVTMELLEEFTSSLSKGNIQIRGISGAWTPEFASLLEKPLPNPSTMERPQGGAGGYTFILASETLYNPESLVTFTKSFVSHTKFSKSWPIALTKALVAAKRLYFGVGGGVDEFARMIQDYGAWSKEVWASQAGQGVARCILEIGMN